MEKVNAYLYLPGKGVILPCQGDGWTWYGGKSEAL